MTQVEFLNAIVNSEITEEVIDYANERLAKHALDLEKAKAKRAEKSVSVDANVEIALAALTDTPQTCTELADVFIANGMERANDKEGKGITSQYVARLMMVLVDAGKAERVKVKVEGKKSKIVAYIAATEKPVEVAMDVDAEQSAPDN